MQQTTFTTSVPQYIDMAQHQQVVPSVQRLLVVPNKFLRQVAQPVRVVAGMPQLAQRTGAIPVAPKQRARLLMLKNILKGQIRQSQTCGSLTVARSGADMSTIKYVPY